MGNFDEYKRLGDPKKHEKAENWQIAIGLQQVDKLEPSGYLIELARKNIEGELSIDEVKKHLNTYYEENAKHDDIKERKDEADKVSAHISEVLSEKTFIFSPAEYIGIHKRLFEGVFSHAGLLRGYNITKGEWVLNGDTVHYASSSILGNALDYDFDKEKNFRYKGLSKKQMAEHIAEFTTSIWQIHPFCEGNTRTTAVFIIKYLRSLGFEGVSNNLFSEHSWYFRNALVRSAATNVSEGVYPDRIYIDRFFGNLLLGEKNVLRNRDLHIKATVKPENATVKTENATVKPGNATAKAENATVKAENATVKTENATVKPGNATVKTENATTKVSATQTVVLELLSGNGRLTAEEIAKDIGKDITTIKRAIKALKEKELLERIGSDKTGYWKVKSSRE